MNRVTGMNMTSKGADDIGQEDESCCCQRITTSVPTVSVLVSQELCWSWRCQVNIAQAMPLPGTEHRRPTVASIPQPSAPAAAFPMTDDAPEPARKQSESEKETEAEPAEEPQETAPKQPDSWWKRLKEIADAEKERAYKKQAGEKAKKEEEL